MNYYNIYTKKDVDSLFKELGEITIGMPNDDDLYFDGYANVYDVMVTYKNDKGNWTEYAISITHEALCYATNGED